MRSSRRSRSIICRTPTSGVCSPGRAQALAPGGVFVNAEQVAGPTGALTASYNSIWERDCRALGATEQELDGARERMRHDRCVDVETQLAWMRQAGFAAADCVYKSWRFAVLARIQGGTMSSTRDWDATTYDRVSAPQQLWAAEQLDGLALRGDEVVLDAGCGSGKVTLELAARVPNGRVYAVDAAPSMVEHARQALGDRATVSCQDLVELELPEPVDLVFSNATFHWIHDHDALFAALHRNMKPGAPPAGAVRRQGQHRTVPQARRRARAARRLGAVLRRLVRSLELRDRRGDGGAAGAGRVHRREHVAAGPPDRARPTDARSSRPSASSGTWTGSPPSRRDAFVDDVLARYGEPIVLDYVRLNMAARRG